MLARLQHQLLGGRQRLLEPISQLFQEGGLVERGSLLINRITGYDQCERLRDAVNEADQRFQQLREQLQSSRVAYTKAVAERSICQKELNGLLQRKPSWMDTDLQRFTELYKTEMRLEASEHGAKENNERLEQLVDQAHHALMTIMRERYQEEQLWSDKIRRASTFGTFGLMGINVVLFLGLQLIVEPRKRRKFIGEFERVVEDKLDQIGTMTVAEPPTVMVSDVQTRHLILGGAAAIVLNLLVMLNFK